MRCLSEASRRRETRQNIHTSATMRRPDTIAVLDETLCRCIVLDIGLQATR